MYRIPDLLLDGHLWNDGQPQISQKLWRLHGLSMNGQNVKFVSTIQLSNPRSLLTLGPHLPYDVFVSTRRTWISTATPSTARSAGTQKSLE